MSKSLAKNALAIIDSDDDDVQSTSKGSGEHISTNKYGLKKEQARLKKRASKKKGKVICDGITSKKSTLERFRNDQKSNKVKKNLKKLEKLKSVKVDKNITRKVLEGLDAMKRKQTQEEPQDDKDEPFFTEDDFQYYVRSII
ncbi:uncharacterized protein LOC107372038 isoform X2 [Tetranychus urticae]|uniref:uncharacterized protein LOC107372038 isoform X2 n=1 Tax=Tetranychus urticae TaxID=32264 RepID=UPI00077BC492|nr:uncharacterized protein LOC107372038 isoform X2 [Tetranychus urticae]